MHSLSFFKTYQVLITAGYENTIRLYGIDPDFYDAIEKGKLVGHQSMITAIQVIEKTPMLISSDDIGTIKVWDVR